MNIFDQAKAKANDLLNSDQGEKKSDEILDRVSDFAKSKLGEDKAAQIDNVRDAIDERMGNNSGDESKG